MTNIQRVYVMQPNKTSTLYEAALPSNLLSKRERFPDAEPKEYEISLKKRSSPDEIDQNGKDSRKGEQKTLEAKNQDTIEPNPVIPETLELEVVEEIVKNLLAEKLQNRHKSFQISAEEIRSIITR